MKNWWLCLLLPFAGFGQSMPGPEGKFIYDITYDFLLPDKSVNELKEQWYSNGHSFSFMGEWYLGPGAGLGYGFGFSIHNLHNNLAFVEVQAPAGAGILTLPSDSSFNVNEQNFSYFDVPFEFRFRGRSTQKGWFFRMSVGVRVGYRITSSAYHRVGDHALRQYRVFDSTPWRTRLYARIGAGKVTLFAGYELLPTIVEQWPGNVSVDYRPTQFHMASVGLGIVL